MSFGWSAATWTAISMAAATAYQTETQRKSGSQARQQAKDLALAQQADADRATNKANAKRPDVGGMMAAATLASRNGQGGTLLTGPGGIDPSTLTLGRTNLLGGGG